MLRCLVALLAVVALAACDDEPERAAGAPAPSTSAASPSPAPSSATPSYVALGDSYTAAPGVPVTETESGCFRSSGNYPSLVARELGAQLTDVSCSGASTLSLVGVQNGGTAVQPPQFDALTAATSLVTLGMGGNDEQLFSTMVGTCTQLASSDPDGSPCRDQMTSGGKDRLLAKVATVGDRVGAALDGIHDRAPDATVVLVGYPQPVPARGDCPTLPLAAGDYPYVRSVTEALDAALRDAADQHDATYVGLLDASRGHDICAGPDAWVNGSQGDLSRAIAFHPFPEEQQAVAELVLAALDG